MSNTAAANHEDFLDIVQDSQSNDAVDEEEEYRIWKKNSPYLYDVLVTAGLTWPSLTVDWIRKVDESTSQLTTCRLVLGTRTDGSEPNYLMVVKVRLPITDLKKKESIDNVEALNQFKKSDKKLETECQMVHDGDVNKARSMPQPEKSNIIATFTDKGEIHIFNYFSHPLKETGDPRPDTILKGHSEIGYGLDWSCVNEGYLCSGGYDNKVCIFDVNNDKSNEPILSWNYHKDKVEDVQFHKQYDYLLASCSDDKSFVLYDSRVKEDCCVERVIGHESEVNCLSFSPHNPVLLLSGGSDNVVLLWDIRNLKQKMHSFINHKDKVMNVKWSPHNSNIFASMSEDKKINIWDILQIGGNISREDNDIATSELIFQHYGHIESPNDFTYCPYQTNLIASVDEGNFLCFWEPSRVCLESGLVGGGGL